VKLCLCYFCLDFVLAWVRLYSVILCWVMLVYCRFILSS
jgi:hypothetical protein